MDKRLLFYQTYDSSGLSAPSAIDSISKKSKEFSVLFDGNGSICLFYIKPYDRKHSIVYRILNKVGKNWSDSLLINNKAEISDRQQFSASIDNKANFHLCFQSLNKQKYELTYLKMPEGRESCSNNAVLASSLYPFANLSLIALNERIIVYWTRESNMFYCMSTDEGNSWSKPEKYNYSGGDLFLYTRFITNTPDSYRNLGSIDLPANLSKGFRPAFIHDFRNIKEEVDDMDDLKASILNALRTISEGIAELNKEIKKANAEIENLKTTVLDMKQTGDSTVQEEEEVLDREALPSEDETDSNISSSSDTGISSDISCSDTGNNPVISGSSDTDRCSDINKENNIDESISNPQYEKANKPIIAGTGFAQITYDYLKKLGGQNE